MLEKQGHDSRPCERTEQDSLTELHVGGFGASSRKCVKDSGQWRRGRIPGPTIAGVSRESLEKHQIAAALRGEETANSMLTFWSGCVPLKAPPRGLI